MPAPLPHPMNAPDCDLRDLDAFPLHGPNMVAFSDEVSAAGFRAAFTLRLRAWQQVPTGSLPSSDRLLCRLADIGDNLRKWQRIKPEALTGFTLCRDGRYYSSEIVDLARPMFEHRLRDRQRQELRREAQGPGWERLRLQVFQRDHYTCRYCGEPTTNPHCDHVEPIAHGGMTTPESLATACPTCNISKGARRLNEWRH